MREPAKKNRGFTTMIMGLLAGTLLGQLIYYAASSEWNLGVTAGSATGLVILVALNAISSARKKDRLPDVDERIRRNLLQFYLVAAYVFIGISAILLAGATVWGRETLSVGTLWIALLVFLVFTGIGGMIVKKR